MKLLDKCRKTIGNQSLVLMNSVLMEIEAPKSDCCCASSKQRGPNSMILYVALSNFVRDWMVLSSMIFAIWDSTSAGSVSLATSMTRSQNLSTGIRGIVCWLYFRFSFSASSIESPYRGRILSVGVAGPWVRSP